MYRRWWCHVQAAGRGAVRLAGQHKRTQGLRAARGAAVANRESYQERRDLFQMLELARILSVRLGEQRSAPRP